jgi:hypothetical protein
MDLYYRVIEATSILYSKIFVSRFFFFDLWSINHMWTGFMLFLILSALKIKRPFAVIMTCLFGYEVFEISLTYFTLNIFIPEIIKDQFTDIFIGLSGSFVAYLLLSNYNYLIMRKPLLLQRAFIFFTSMSFSFLWLVFSHESVCYEGHFYIALNLLIFFIWLAQSYFTIVVFRNNGFFNRFRPWSVFILSFIISVFLNFFLISLSDSIVMNPETLVNWIYSIKTKLILAPLLPFLLLTVYEAFIKLITKSVTSSSKYRVDCAH